MEVAWDIEAQYVQWWCLYDKCGYESELIIVFVLVFSSEE